MLEISDFYKLQDGKNLRLETLVNIRWLAIGGQTLAVLVVWLYLGFSFSPELCLLLIAASAILNAALRVRYPANQRFSANASATLLAYDIVQLTLLLFLTGGLQNPFAILLVVPVVISATTLSIAHTSVLGALVIVCSSLLVFVYFPLPWIPGEKLELPRIYIAGMWVAIFSSLSFTAIYAFRVADEARKLAEALTATELVLQREQHLSSLDGLAAAAAHELGTPLATITLVAKEMIRELDHNSAMLEDVRLLSSQAERCRQILQKLRSLSAEGDQHIGRMPLSSIMEEVSDPHRDFGVEIMVECPRQDGEPQCIRNPAILYGLGNLIDNAVDHANSRVLFAAGWDQDDVWVTVSDDGKGYDIEIIERIGEPFVRSRARGRKGEGLGLGLFIAKTLLERSGAVLRFSNMLSEDQPGAYVRIDWKRSALEANRNPIPFDKS